MLIIIIFNIIIIIIVFIIVTIILLSHQSVASHTQIQLNIEAKPEKLEMEY